MRAFLIDLARFGTVAALFIFCAYVIFDSGKFAAAVECAAIGKITTAMITYECHKEPK